eukprot:g18601.t1
MANANENFVVNILAGPLDGIAAKTAPGVAEVMNEFNALLSVVVDSADQAYELVKSASSEAEVVSNQTQDAAAQKETEGQKKCWAHEAHRVFYDRLVTKDDQQWFQAKISEILKDPDFWMSTGSSEMLAETPLDHWPLDVALRLGAIQPASLPRCEEVVANYYQQVEDPPQLVEVLNNFLVEYNTMAKRGMDLVLFMAAAQHVSQVVRVLKTPLGNALLVGVGGSGRKSLATLAAFSIGFAKVAEAARSRGVCGLALPHLGHSGWEELGIASAVDRAKIMGYLAELEENGYEKNAASSSPPPPDSAETHGGSAWRRLKQRVRRMDIAVPVDHKKLWFEKMARSGKAPEEIKDSLAAQMDSCSMRWDDQGWPLSRTRFAYLVFSAFFSFMLYAHFGWSHIASVMVADVSNANLRVYMESIGIPVLTELGMLFAMNFFCFFFWVIFTMVALISEDAHWIVWLIVGFGVGFASWLAVHFISKVMARSGFEHHLTACPFYLRLQAHAGLFSNDPIPIDPSLPRRTLLELLSQRALQELDGKQEEARLAPVSQCNFRRRVRMFPSLVNCCTIDWFHEWPDAALQSVAHHFLGKIGMPENVLNGVVNICVAMQKSVFTLAERFQKEVQRYYYVTPTSYLELINAFKGLLSIKQDEVSKIKSRYDVGLDKIMSTEEQVTTMQAELEELKPTLKKTAEDTDRETQPGGRERQTQTPPRRFWRYCSVVIIVTFGSLCFLPWCPGIAVNRFRSDMPFRSSHWIRIVDTVACVSISGLAALCVSLRHPASSYVRHAIWSIWGIWMLVLGLMLTNVLVECYDPMAKCFARHLEATVFRWSAWLMLSRTTDCLPKTPSFVMRHAITLVNVATLCIHLTAAVDTFFDPNEGRPVVAVVSQLVLSGTFVFLWILGVGYPCRPVTGTQLTWIPYKILELYDDDAAEDYLRVVYITGQRLDMLIKAVSVATLSGLLWTPKPPNVQREISRVRTIPIPVGADEKIWAAHVKVLANRGFTVSSLLDFWRCSTV